MADAYEKRMVLRSPHYYNVINRLASEAGRWEDTEPDLLTDPGEGRRMARAIRETRQAVEDAWNAGVDTAAPAERRRATCVGCGCHFALRKDGCIRAHGSGVYGCPGSGQPPRNGAALAWLLNHASVPAAVVDHFWHLEEGRTCDCEESKHA